MICAGPFRCKLTDNALCVPGGFYYVRVTNEKGCAEWGAPWSVFTAYAFEVSEHEKTARTSRSLELVIVPIPPSRSLSASYHSFIPPLVHTTTRSYPRSSDHPLSRLGICFDARTSLSVANVTPTVHAGLHLHKPILEPTRLISYFPYFYFWVPSIFGF